MRGRLWPERGGAIMITKRRFQEEEQMPEQKKSRTFPLSCSSEVHLRTLLDVLEKASYLWMQGLGPPGSMCTAKPLVVSAFPR